MAQTKSATEMKKATESKLLEKAQKEFYSVVNTFILPLCDPRGTLKLENRPEKNSSLVSFYYDQNKISCLRFFPCVSTNNHVTPFYLEIKTYSSKSIVKRLNVILRELLKVMEYNCFDGKIRKQRDYGKSKRRCTSYKLKTLQLAFELGMCSWVAPNNGALILHSILCRMEEWAARTYEGKRVPFGFVVDFGAEADKNAASYLHFLSNDSSAVFTDGVFSGIKLDRNGKILSFITRNTPVKAVQTTQEMFVPHQFSDIGQHCFGKAIGVIVLTNGEILLVKQCAICFAKRGTKWVSFDWDRVYSKLLPYFLMGADDLITAQKKIKNIYKTLLDVSFSHVGGCLAFVRPDVSDTDISKIIKDRLDLAGIGELPAGVSAESKEKIAVLRYLLSDNNFFEIEAPLRKEILSLDGATVVSPDGSFYCAGSIVSVPGGSSHGGRTAAAKRLAALGVGIKISEDGYIEAYGSFNNAQNHASKACEAGNSDRLTILFKIR